MRSNNIGTTVVGIATCLAGTADAFWRMPCSGRLLLERADPIVNPGKVAGHVHTISGGNGFGFNTSFDQMRASTCSSCPIKQDLSAYWTPKLYFIAEDGTYEDVPQAGEGNGDTGGMTVYYQQRGGPKNNQLHAFPEGFRMLAGDPFARNETGEQAAPGKAVSFVCLSSDSSPQTDEIPNTNCPDGLRAQIYFPSCWDGENVDSEDHKSHMAYPIGQYDNGDCPSSHPKHLISIFYEVIYSIDSFKDRWHGSGHPFVFAQGDRTGYGFHGDFVNGWNISALQQATDKCTNLSGRIEDCDVFDNNGTFSTAEQQACRIPPSVDEEITGVLKKLPGCNTPTDGPEYAPPQTNCAPGVIGKMATYYTDMTSEGWAYAGCADDDYFERTLTGPSTSSSNMTVKTCVDFCESKGHVLAGLEWARECYCGDEYSKTDRAPKAGILGACTQACSGDEKEICGAGGALSMYKKCEGGECQNAAYGTSQSSDATRRKRHVGQHKHGRQH